MTMQLEQKARLKNGARQFAAELRAFWVQDRARCQSFAMQGAMGLGVASAGLVLVGHDESLGFALLGIGVAMVSMGLHDVGSWRLGQMKKRLEALEDRQPMPPGVGDAGQSRAAPSASAGKGA